MIAARFEKDPVGRLYPSSLASASVADIFPLIWGKVLIFYLGVGLPFHFVARPTAMPKSPENKLFMIVAFS